MGDTLCKLDDAKKAARLARDPHWVCKKCGRVANKKKWLCKPLPLDS